MNLQQRSYTLNKRVHRLNAQGNRLRLAFLNQSPADFAGARIDPQDRCMRQHYCAGTFCSVTTTGTLNVCG